MAFLTTRTELKKSGLEDTQSTILSAVPTEKNLADRVDITPINYYIYNMKGINMQKTITKYQSKFAMIIQYYGVKAGKTVAIKR